MSTRSNPRRALEGIPFIGSLFSLAGSCAVGGVFLLWVAWMFLSLGTHILRTDYRLTHEGREAQATVTRIEEVSSSQRSGSSGGNPLFSNSGPRSHVVYYRFVDAANVPHQGSEILSHRPRPRPVSQDDTITIHYVPSDPTICAFEHEVVPGYFFVGGGATALGVSVLLFSLAKRFRDSPGLLGARHV